MGTVHTMLAEGDDEEIISVYQWMESLGVNLQDKQGVIKWLGKRIEWGGVECTRLVQVFYRLAQKHRL